ncbi:MAG TPA: DNA replication/repair protein RecF [Candidatus Dormibacteraeota bacterium]|nr:DNA replication/repair protein RecF [Candidatus Dormibacteraeota bacterium]
MIVRSVTLGSFRNYASLAFEPSPGLNLIVGRNAQGKSNLLEAIALLGIGKSFRTSREAELIQCGQSLAFVDGAAELARGSVELSCRIALTSTGARKTYAVNGAPVRYAKFLGSIKVVTFMPADLLLVTGAPSLRRAMLNATLSQERPTYYADLARYSKQLAQKSAHLRTSAQPDRELVAAYNVALADLGARLMLARARYAAQLAAAARAVHQRWIPHGQTLGVVYRPNPPIPVPDEATVRGDLQQALDEAMPREVARRQAIVGPHRDDLELTLGEQSLAQFGSQGQQRTAVLALKAAEYAVLRERTAEAPVLLLDDVLSELDAERQEAFLGSVEGYEQAFVTATALPTARALGSAHYVVESARLSRIR